MIVPRFCQIKQGESFSRCLVTKRWGREGTSRMGGRGTQVPAKAMAQETPTRARTLTLPHGMASRDLALQVNAWHSGHSPPGTGP